VKERKFLGVTKDNKAETLEKILKREITEKGKRVPVVNMDMDKRIKGVVRRVFPDADIVADKFHVAAHTNKVIDLCRIAVEKSVNERFEIKRILLMKTKMLDKIRHKTKWEQKVKKFESILKAHPEIKILWDLKNKLHGFYKCKNLETAKVSWKALHEFLEKHEITHPEFSDLRKTFTNWEAEILNHFVHRTTNAYIEGLNNRIETLKRKKWGFRNKENFIKSLCYMLFPISEIFSDLIFVHWF
jgi:transposase